MVKHLQSNGVGPEQLFEFSPKLSEWVPDKPIRLSGMTNQCNEGNK